MTSEYESVDHPAHYGGADNPFEPIKIIHHYDLNFCLGNVIKYVLRAARKPGEPEIQDLKKAATYLDMHIKNCERSINDKKIEEVKSIIENMENEDWRKCARCLKPYTDGQIHICEGLVY